ncbi:MAG: hypothetical protein JWP74_4012 [Marmoricola sp.]|nr:hypothetical protein [Marmoricola sp.]
MAGRPDRLVLVAAGVLARQLTESNPVEFRFNV